MITAREYRSHVAGASAAEYQNLEARIDNAIVRGADVSNGVPSRATIAVNVEGFTKAVRERAVSEYTVAGWDARIVSDYVEGDFLWLRCP